MKRLSDLHIMFLKGMRYYSDMDMVFKFRHGICGCTLDNIVLSFLSGVTSGAGVHIPQQAPSNNLVASKYNFRATTNWNKFSKAIASLQPRNNFESS